MMRAMAARAAAVLLAAGALLGSGDAHAAYPERPIRWVVPYAAGGTTDVIARNVAETLTQMFGYTIVIENRPGAGGQLAMSGVAKGDTDGYTFLVSDASLATAPSLYKGLSFDPEKDLKPVALFATVPHVLVVHPNVKSTSLAEFIALSKAQHGRLNFGSGGVGSPLHLAGEALRAATGIEWTHVPYRGAGPAVQAVVAEQVDVATPSLPTALSLVQAGNLRALAVMSPSRIASLPDTPTAAELGYPGASVVGWVGLHASSGTPAEIVAAMEGAVAKALASEQLRARLESQGATVASRGGPAYGQMVSEEIRRWKGVVSAAGIPQL